MPFEFRCTGCNALLQVPDSAAGEQARCPHCGQISPVAEAQSNGIGLGDAADTRQGSWGGPAPDHPTQPASAEENPYAAPALDELLTRPVHDPKRFLSLPLASRWKRLGASILDSLVHVGAMIPGFIALAVFGDADDTLALVAMVVMFGGLAVVAIYNCILISRTGQSIAKWMLAMRIVTTDGELPGFVRGVLVRLWLPMMINQFCGLFSFVDALFIFGEPRRCIHDYMANTIVVESIWNPTLFADSAAQPGSVAKVRQSTPSPG